MYHETQLIKFKTNEELDKELDRLHSKGYYAWHYHEKWFGSEIGGIALVKFKVQ